MQGYAAPIGGRVIDDQLVIVQELGFVFTRLERHQRLHNRDRILTEGKRWLHLTLALERWLIKKARREAAKLGLGLAYSKPYIEYQREPSIRGWHVAVFLNWAAVGRMGETIRFQDGISKDWQPL